MSYQLQYVFNLPSGLTINAELYDSDIPPNQVGPTITTNIVDNGDNTYSYLATIPDNHIGSLVFFDTAELLRNWRFAINPAEAEYLSTYSAAQLAKSASTIVSGSAVAGSLSTTQMSTDLTEATDNHYNGRVLIWTSGTLKDQAAAITGYNGSTKTFTFTPITEAPLAGDTFVIL